MNSGQTATSNKQRALWLLEQLVPETGVNNLGLGIQVSGRLRPDVLKAALAIVVGRFEVLRTVFRATGADLVQEIVPAADFAVRIESLDLSGDSLERDLTAFVDQPFRLDGRPLIRVGFATHPDGDILCVAVHHLVFDMVSVGLFLQAFGPVYDAIAAGRPVPAQDTAPASTLADPEPQAADLAYWRETLEGFDPAGLDLWCGTPRGRQPMLAGASASRELSAEAQQAAAQLQRAVRAPLGAVMLATYAALLASHGAGPDLVVGSPIDVRGANTSAIGYHVNVVPIRIRVDFAEGFGALARQARDAFLGALAHAGTPVDELTGELPGVGTSWQTQLFRHLFNFLPAAPIGELSIDGMTARLLTVENPHSKFDLELVGSPAQADLTFRYSETLSRSDVEALLDRFEALLVAAAQDLDRPLGETAGWSRADRLIVDQANTTMRAAITAPDGRELPVGVQGELRIDGHGVGELARWRTDGTIEWLGRIERQTTHDEDPADPDQDTDQQEPAAEDALVEELVEIWRQLLNIEAAAQTNFFDSGGHSLLAAVLAQKVEELTGTALELSDVFKHPTPAALAARVRA